MDSVNMDYVPYIGANGNWYVNDIDTGVKAQGPQGEPGEVGTQGLKGDKGDIGPAGSQGIPGEKGEKGDAGATGSQGEQGPKGDKGDTPELEPNLITTEEGKALDATMGKILDDKISRLDTEYEGFITSFQNGCSIIANRITELGCATAVNAGPDIISQNISVVASNKYNEGIEAAKKGTATEKQVLRGYTFTNNNSVGLAGTMANRGNINTVLNCGQTYVISEGYHSGGGKVTAKSLLEQTSATAVAGNISAGKTAWVNGVKVTGTGEDNTAQYNAGYNVGRSDPLVVKIQTNILVGRDNKTLDITRSGYKAIHVGVTSAQYQASTNSNTVLAPLSVSVSASGNMAVFSFPSNATIGYDQLNILEIIAIYVPL